ncbi:MAG: CPBP family intramembrane metalloprotease [Pseudoxanthomonas sp.]
MIPLLHAALVLFLILVFPVWDRRETRRLKAGPSPARRIRSYQKTIAWLWAATLLLLATRPWIELNAPPPGHGLDGHESLSVWLSLPLLLGLFLPVVAAWKSPRSREAMRAQFASLDFFLPQTAPERYWFAAVSVSAGICEEIIFRGFLIDYLVGLPFGLGVWPATFVAALVFGIDHGYQGWKGVIVTGFTALAFSGIFFVSGSLWLPIAIHILIDLRALLLSKVVQEQAA